MRLPALSLMRFVAIGAVIWTHAASGLHPGGHFDIANAGRFGSAFFTQCSVFLVLLKSVRRPALSVGEYASGRFERIYVPFLLWGAIYIVAQDARAFVEGGTPFVFSWAFFWNGSEYHLWFLPFILVAGLVIFGIGRWVGAHPRFAIPVAVVLALVGIVASGRYSPAPHDVMPDEYALRLAWNRLPSVCWATAIGIAYLQQGPEPRAHPSMALLGGVTLVASVVTLGAVPTQHAFENLAGTGALILALSVSDAVPLDWAEPLGRLAYGMYLSHLLVLSAVRMAWQEGVGAADDPTFVAVATVVVLAGSALLTAFIRRSRHLRILVPA